MYNLFAKKTLYVYAINFLKLWNLYCHAYIVDWRDYTKSFIFKSGC